MTISERIFSIMEEKDISMSELSRLTGISRHTIFDWRKKNTNPGADKILIICETLRVTPEELLSAGNNEILAYSSGFSHSTNDLDNQIIQECRGLSITKKKRLLAYISMLVNMKE